MKFSKVRCLFLIISLCSAIFVSGQSNKTRLVVLADMGNEPDEEQQIMHLMMYANEMDIEGLIAVTGKYLNPASKSKYKQVLHPELFNDIIDGYSKVVDKLKKHADGWLSPEYLRSVVVSGQTGYGIGDVGGGKQTAGSKLLIDVITKDDTRPVYVVVNAGSNTLAQAIIDFEATHTKDELNVFLAKLRVFENGAQDDAGAWICAKYPNIHWTRSNYQTYCYGGPDYDAAPGLEAEFNNLGPYTWEPYAYSGVGQHQWALEHIKGDHGVLGKSWPIRQNDNGKIVYLEGGGTIPWLGLVHSGLTDINQPHWGSWSGRFTKTKVKNVYSRHASVKENEVKYDDFYLYTEAIDRWINPENDSLHHNIYAPVWRWRRAMYNDFKCRMDWCIEPYAQANHSPIAAINGDNVEKINFIEAIAGTSISFDAGASTDPDGDSIFYSWWIYNEAGNYEEPLIIENANQAKMMLAMPKNAKGKEIHLILEIKDDNKIASMYDYRRVVIQVR